jgi:diguanylate cyclase (GGDEF)-like protein/PAS domain S-box-containing protein
VSTFSAHYDEAPSGLARPRFGVPVPTRLAGLVKVCAWAVSSPKANLGAVLLFEWACIAFLTAEVMRWSWFVSLVSSALLMTGISLPLRILIVRPSERQLAEMTFKLEGAQVAVTERDMMVQIAEDANRQQRAVFDSSPEAVLVVSLETMHPIEFNTTALRLFGYARDEFLSLPAARLFRNLPEAGMRDRLGRAARGAIERFESICVTRAGESVNVGIEMHAIALHDDLAVACVVHDISSEVEARQALQSSHDRMESMIRELELRNEAHANMTQLGGVLQACVSLEEAYAAVSRFGQRLFPATTGALYVYSNSRSDLELVSSWNPPADGFEERIAPADCWGLRQGHVYDHTDQSANLPCRHTGTAGDVPSLCLPLTAQGETLGLVHIRLASVGEAADVGWLPAAFMRTMGITVSDQVTMAIANLKLRDTLRHQSVHDALTGLYNRRHMEESLNREIPRALRIGKPLAVVMADLDHFKTFNDNYGHEAGDAVLAEVGHLLKSSVRSSDIACRYGGEEFALVLPDTAIDGTLARLEAIREHIASLRVPYRGQTLGGLTISMGVALLPEHGSTPEDLLLMADKALYHAKRAGRNQVQLAEGTVA